MIDDLDYPSPYDEAQLDLDLGIETQAPQTPDTPAAITKQDLEALKAEMLLEARRQAAEEFASKLVVPQAPEQSTTVPETIMPHQVAQFINLQNSIINEVKEKYPDLPKEGMEEIVNLVNAQQSMLTLNELKNKSYAVKIASHHYLEGVRNGTIKKQIGQSMSPQAEGVGGLPRTTQLSAEDRL